MIDMIKLAEMIVVNAKNSGVKFVDLPAFAENYCIDMKLQAVDTIELLEAIQDVLDNQ